MLTGGVPVDLRRTYWITRTVAGALWLSLGVYLVVAHAVAAAHAPFTGFAPASQRTTFRLVCFALAAVALLAARSVRTRILAGVPTLHVAPHRDVSPMAQRLFTATIVTLALWEAVAVLGFVGFLFTGSLLDLYAFIALAAIGLTVHFPRYSRWDAYASGRRPDA
jgi:hypothetical protein